MSDAMSPGKSAPVFDRIVNAAISRKKTVVLLWVIGLLLLTPVIMTYSNYVSYSSNTGGSSSYESTKASQILSSVNPQNSSLVVVVSLPSAYNLSIANITLNFQHNITSATIPFVSSTDSAFSAYASYINRILHNSKDIINQTYSSITSLNSLIFQFPSSFYKEWSKTGYSTSEVYAAALQAGYTNTSQQNFFISALNSSLQHYSQLGPYYNVQNATNATALSFYGSDQFTPIILEYGSVLNYSEKTFLLTSIVLKTEFGVPITEKLVKAEITSSNPGQSFVRDYGLTSAPDFIFKQYVSRDNSTYLVNVLLNVSDSYRGSGNFYPAQSIVPQVRNITEKYFGSEASVTGNGAVSYDLQKSQSNSFIGFIFTFVFLAIIVGLVLRSYISPVLALILVSIATVLGYVSVFVVGAFYQPVNYIVTYTLTAVLLGVSTDYLLFILARYREELASGTPQEEAIRTASSKSGRAVVVSGLTVATSLGTMFFVTGLNTWGPVLFLAVLFTVLAEVTFLPAVASLIGKRMFRNIRTVEPKKSVFYKAAEFSSKRKKAIIAAIIICAVPALYFWFEAPVSYDISGELPASLPSVKALNLVNEKFGSSALYPAFVIMNLSSPAYAGNNLSQAAYDQIASAESYIMNTTGVVSVIGPGASNGSLGNPSFLFNSNNSVYFIVELNSSPYSQSAINSVQHLRDNSSFIVGGITSGVIDLKNTSQKEYTTLEILIVAAIGIIIGVSFRSVKFPLIALSGVFISISWTLGLLYVVVRFMLHETLIFLIPVILFIILMSLGNDFTVFLISRIKEEQKKNGFSEGLYRGMAGSGSVVTALGIILAASLGSLGLVPIAFLQQMGLAFAVSLLIDTFVIRTLYFPAMISLLSRKGSQVRKS